MALARPLGRLTGPVTGRAAVLVALAAVAVASVVALALAVPRISAADEREDRRTAVLDAARQHAVNFTTLDYRHLERDLDRVLAGSTGDFRKQFEAGTANLTQLVTSNRAVSEGEVLEAGIVSSDEDSARALVVADSTVTNSSNQAPQKRHYRIQMDLVQEGGRWLVSDLQFVG